MDPIPQGFAEHIIEVWEDEGAAWIDALPALVAAYERGWGLTVGPPFPQLSYNYVAPAVRADGGAAVLKLGVPRDEIRTEIEALRLYDGHGIIGLLEADPDGGVMLLERLQPGTHLRDLADPGQATGIAVRVMRELWRPLPATHSFPCIADWAGGLDRLRATFDGGTGPFPARLVEEAARLYGDLLGSMDAPVLLHGDLHHDNILRGERAPWLAIDPKGIAGEPAFEPYAFLLNSVPDDAGSTETAAILQRGIDRFGEELGLDGARIRAWTLAQAVLSGWWSYEDEGYGWERAFAIADVLSTVPE